MAAATAQDVLAALVLLLAVTSTALILHLRQLRRLRRDAARAREQMVKKAARQAVSVALHEIER